MARYLFQVTYTLPDGTVAHEPHAIDAATQADAEAEVDAATQRYPAMVGATKAITLVLTA